MVNSYSGAVLVCVFTKPEKAAYNILNMSSCAILAICFFVAFVCVFANKEKVAKYSSCF